MGAAKSCESLRVGRSVEGGTIFGSHGLDFVHISLFLGLDSSPSFNFTTIGFFLEASDSRKSKLGV